MVFGNAGKNFESRMARSLQFFLVTFFVAAAGAGSAQEPAAAAPDPATVTVTETDIPTDEPVAPGEAANPEAETAAVPVAASPVNPSPPKSPAELQAEMLERLADKLSLRMRTLKDREAALTAREAALAEREKVTAEREREIGLTEEMMQLREEVVKRRETLPPPQSWNGPEVPTTYGQYAAVVDGQTMQFYHLKNGETHTPVASTQKLMTALVVCMRGGGLDEMADVPAEVLRIEPTLVGVKPGERYTRRKLLTALLVKSGNDIAATLAIDHAGSIEAFAAEMNQLAKTLGMKDSHFINPHGLPAAGQYSTARDIAIAAYEAYQIPDIREMIARKTFDFVFNDGRVYTMPNTNRVLGEFPGCNGMKTGFTYAAGNCLVSSASIDGKDRISVVIKSARPAVWEDSKKLLQWSLDLEFKGDLNPGPIQPAVGANTPVSVAY